MPEHNTRLIIVIILQKKITVKLQSRNSKRRIRYSISEKNSKVFPIKLLILEESYKKILSFVNLTEISYLAKRRHKNGYVVVIGQRNGYLVGV